MPQLLLFTPCRRASIDFDDKLLSISAVFTGISFVAASVAPDATVPYDWAVALQWLILPGELGQVFETRVRLRLPDGAVWKGLDETHKIKAEYTTSNGVINVPNFPIGQTGQLMLVAEIKNAEDPDWQIAAEHPMFATVIEASTPTP